MTPSQIVANPTPVRAYGRLSFTINISGVTAMVYRLVTKESFRIVGIKKTVPIVFLGPNKDIDAMWQSLTMDRIQRWKALSNTEPAGIISASTNFGEERMSGGGTHDHYIGAATSQEGSGEEAILEVGAGQWAVFEVVGDFPTNLQKTWGRIASDWFPTSPYELREGPEILWNEGPDTSKPDFRSEIWMPIVKKPTKY